MKHTVLRWYNHYIWHYTLLICICVISPSVCMTSYSVCMAWHEVFMTSHQLYSWHHIKCIWYHPYFFHGNTMTIPGTSPTIFDITATVSVSSHLLYWWRHNMYGSHHSWHTHAIIHILHEITLTIYDINAQYLWHHSHYIWHWIDAISVITSTVLMISHQLYSWDLMTNCMYDITLTLYMTSYATYIMSHPLFMTSQDCSHHSTSTAFMTSHTHYIWHHTHDNIYL